MGLNDEILDFEGWSPVKKPSKGFLILIFSSSDFMGKFQSNLIQFGLYNLNCFPPE